MPDVVLEELELPGIVTAMVVVARIARFGQLQMPFAGHAHAPFMRAAVYVPVAV